VNPKNGANFQPTKNNHVMKTPGKTTMLLICLALLCLVSKRATGGELVGSATPVPAMVNLTLQGTLDWADWGESTGMGTNFLEQKAGGTNQISDVTAIGAGSGPNVFGGTVVATVWSDGTPDAAETNTSGLYYNGMSNGYQITVPADTSMKILTVYAGGYGTIVHFEAALSDSSAPPYMDQSLSDPGGNSFGAADAYTVEFAAGTSGQTLTVTVTCAADYGFGNVTLMAATLASPKPSMVTQPESQTNNDTQTAQLSALAEGWAPLSYQWWVESDGVYVPLADAGQISGSGMATLTISNLAAANATNYYVVVTNSYGAVTSSVAALTILPLTGTLLGAALPVPSAVDLTTAGTLDWAAWGYLTGDPPNNLEQKAGGTNQISDITTIGAGSGPNLFGNALVACSWSDGTPDAVVTNTTTGIYFNGIEDGCQFTVPADTTKKVLTVYAGGYSCQMQIQATLSDNSAPPYIDSSLNAAGGVSLADAYTIEFSAGSAGQTLTVKVVCLTGTGNCTLMAATLAGPKPNFVQEPVSLTNNIGTTAQFTALTEGWLPLSFQWWKESNNVYVPMADASHISGSATATLTLSDLFLTNGTNYYLVVTNNYGAITSSVATLTVLPVIGTLIGSATTAPTNVDLTTEGTWDWADWGELSGIPPNYLEQKAGGTNQISDVATIGGGPNQFGNAVVTYSWSDGTPDLAETNTSGIYFLGLDNGYQISLPADSTTKLLTVYAGAYGSIVNFQAALSDASAPPYHDESLFDPGGNSNGSADAYAIQFAAGSSNQTLTINVTCDADYGGGNVTLMAATLAPPPLALQFSYSAAALKLTWPSGTLQQATSLTGPWSAITNTSPFTFTPSAAQMFFRVKAN
jgi:hypothetical protein